MIGPKIIAVLVVLTGIYVAYQPEEPARPLTQAEIQAQKDHQLEYDIRYCNSKILQEKMKTYLHPTSPTSDEIKNCVLAGRR